jgi:hypothetical protein
MRLAAIVALSSAAIAGVAQTAFADELLVRAPGAQHLAAGDGYLVWASPGPAGRWRLALRGPDGQTRSSAVRSFGAAPDPAIGRLGGRVTVVYSRCAGASATRDCDVYSYDVATNRERPVAGTARAGRSETAPSLSQTGRLAWVQRKGTAPGIYTATASSRPERRYSHVASETAVVGKYVVFTDTTPYLPDGCCVIVRAVRSTGAHDEYPISFGNQVGSQPFALTGVGSRAFFLETHDVPTSTIPLDPRGRGHRDIEAPASADAAAALPATVNSFAATRSVIDVYLDAAGVKRLDHPLFPPLP